MRGKSTTVAWSLIRNAARCLAFWTQLKRARQLVRPAIATSLAALLAVGPLLAQNPPQQNPPQQTARPQQPPPPPSPASQAYTPTPTTPPIPVSLGLSKYNYTRSPRAFPNIIAPYRPIHVPDLTLTNSPRIEQLIHDNKLELTLQDAVELALENSMDIVVARYNPWFAETDILAAKAGGLPQGAAGEEVRFSFANIPSFNFDPTLISSLAYDDRTTPVNNPLISGTGAAATNATLFSHTAQYNTQLTQGFSTGTVGTIAWNNTRSSTSSSFNFFNPDVSSSLILSVQQQLLNGFGRFANRRNIIIAQNNRKLTDYVFEQQAITTVTNTITAYWELVYAREAVTVQQAAVSVSEKLYNDNRKQLEIGTMAPLDVTRAEAQLAGDRQNLIISQTIQLQDQQTLKNAISRDPLAPNIINVEIIPTDKPTPPAPTEAASFEDAVKQAFAKRPELLEQEINITNAAIDVRATGIALRPTASLFAQYTSQGLSGVSNIAAATQTTIAGAPIVDANGNPVPGEFEPITFSPITGRNQLGFTDAQSQIFHNKFPDYLVALTLNIPIRNRLAQSTSQRSILQLRQIQAQMQQLKNAAVVDVHNAYIALTQDRSQVEAASKARQLQQQTFEAEQKRYQLGASTVYNVILTQRDFVTAEGNELRALANLLEAKAQYERALAITLDVNRVSIADAKHGEIERETLIPGTLHGKVVGTDELFIGHR
jgi:outer membrane protein